MVMKYLSGDTKDAGRLQLEMKHLIDAMFIEVIRSCKAALNLMGKIELDIAFPFALLKRNPWKS